jgi:hypothetical protein
VLALLALFAATIVVPACSSGTTTTVTTASGALSVKVPWRSGESASYDIRDTNGVLIGKGVLGVEKQSGQYLLKQLYTDSVGNTVSNSTMTVDALTLAPVSENAIIPLAAGDAQLMSAYSGGKVSIVAKTSDGTGQSTELDVPPGAYDNDETLFLLRALPLTVGYQLSFTNMVTSAATSVEVDINVVSQDTVEVPAGSFKAYQVELTVEGTKQYLWYGVDAPHHLIRYQAHDVYVLTRIS